jgi:Polyketide cyclase / dehydrase and lipid transport
VAIPIEIIVVLGVVLVLIVAVLAFIATRPSNFIVERSAIISAPGDVVFGMINDFHQWGQWSPWDKRDLDMKKTYEGPSAGPGASYAWDGNKNVGMGRMTILDCKPGESVSIKLEFFKPFAGTNQTTFKLAPSGAGTRVNWSMAGKYNFMAKVFCLFMDMDKMVGKDFEQGLANLNTVAQAETQRLRQAAR